HLSPHGAGGGGATVRTGPRRAHLLQRVDRRRDGGAPRVARSAHARGEEEAPEADREGRGRRTLMGAPLSLDAVLAFGFGTTARATAIVLGALLLARL